ncbi:hypothetical protein [Bradyrhizobium vignae]|uniref:hypothetical protein n=1 Tax=Bradyrhizobium vignae TaxID=1549949 RepID=UPI00100B4215|nr:hypothetical protein [Bradyrhizobium vignae]RXG84039.1 hypothetical protein EAV90_37970 [Bradyrhizobium vignae]
MTARAAELHEHGAAVITLGKGETDFETSLAAWKAGICAIRDGRRNASRSSEAGSCAGQSKGLQSRSRVQFSIHQTTVFCSTKQIFNAIFARLDTEATAFGRRRDHWLVGSVCRRIFDSGQRDQSRPKWDLLPQELDRAICS